MDTNLEPAPRLSRRRLVGLAIGGGAAAALAPVAGAVPVGAEGARAPTFIATPARVLASDGTAVTAEALDVAQAPPEPWAAVPVAGFPWGLVPREDDHVAVTDGFQDLAIAAVPLCTWVEGVPTPAGGGYVIAGHQTVTIEEIHGEPAEALSGAAATGRAVSVCLADTDRPDALVLQVRTPGPPPAANPGS